MEGLLLAGGNSIRSATPFFFLPLFDAVVTLNYTRLKKIRRGEIFCFLQLQCIFPDFMKIEIVSTQ